MFTFACRIAVAAAAIIAVAPVSTAMASRGAVLWSGDFETGNLTQFADAPWNFIGAPRPAPITSPVDEGRFAGRIVLPAGVARSELVGRHLAGSLRRGQVRYFAFSVYLPSDFAISSSWRVFAQWKNSGTGSPPLQLAMYGARWRLEGGWNGGECDDVSVPRTAWTGKVQRGRWTRFVVGVKFQEGTPNRPYRGWVELWKDGVRVLERTPWETLYRSCSSYLKLGLYRDSSIRSRDVVGVDGWRMGTTYASVDR